MKNLMLLLLLILFAVTSSYSQETLRNRYNVPSGFHRIETDAWGNYLRNFPIYPSDYICHNCYGSQLYDSPKGAVLKIDLIGEDLQQCADACMRLRAEFLHQAKRDGEIVFHDTNGKIIPWSQNATFRRYLARVFGYANSYSLEKYDTKPTTLERLRIGDMFCIGGFPGHVVIIMDIAKDKDGNVALLCAQSWMPAQEIEIIDENPSATNYSDGWLIIDKDYPISGNIFIGNYVFELSNLRTWLN